MTNNYLKLEVVIGDGPWPDHADVYHRRGRCAYLIPFDDNDGVATAAAFRRLHSLLDRHPKGRVSIYQDTGFGRAEIGAGL